MSSEVLEFWFGSPPYTAERLDARMRFWFGQGAGPEQQAQADAALQARFGALAETAARGDLDDWRASPRGRLALILLLDQFPRNLHRGTAQAFAQDHKALELTLEALRLGADAPLHPVERVFVYMPLQHAESREMQQQSVEMYRRLADDSPPQLAENFAAFVHYARLHRDIIERFGRFPHRNEVLGRTSTEAESDWLAAGGPSFGQ